jgi:hypothetical protein
MVVVGFGEDLATVILAQGTHLAKIGVVSNPDFFLK